MSNDHETPANTVQASCVLGTRIRPRPPALPSASALLMRPFSGRAGEGTLWGSGSAGLLSSEVSGNTVISVTMYRSYQFWNSCRSAGWHFDVSQVGMQRRIREVAVVLTTAQEHDPRLLPEVVRVRRRGRSCTHGGVATPSRT